MAVEVLNHAEEGGVDAKDLGRELFRNQATGLIESSQHSPLFLWVIPTL